MKKVNAKEAIGLVALAAVLGLNLRYAYGGYGYNKENVVGAVQATKATKADSTTTKKTTKAALVTFPEATVSGTNGGTTNPEQPIDQIHWERGDITHPKVTAEAGGSSQKENTTGEEKTKTDTKTKDSQTTVGAEGGLKDVFGLKGEYKKDNKKNNEEKTSETDQTKNTDAETKKNSILVEQHTVYGRICCNLGKGTETCDKVGCKESNPCSVMSCPYPTRKDC